MRLSKPLPEITTGRCLALLAGAAALVGVAIATGGPAARLLNGLGGLVWVGAFVATVRHARPARPPWMWMMGFGVTLTLVLLVKPNVVVWATIGFVAAGFVVAALAQTKPIVWALFIPAAWLPVHLGVAVFRIAIRTIRDLPAPIRTEPPPTAAIVPLVMVLAAWSGGQLYMFSRRSPLEIASSDAQTEPAP